MSIEGPDSDPFDIAEELTREAEKEAQEIAGQPDVLQTLVFLDMSGSTGAKIAYGNAVGVSSALVFTTTATAIVNRHGGRVVKTLGDGVMATFTDPIEACTAALALRYVVHEKLGESMTAGLTLGRPYRVDLRSGATDLLGDVVDRAARIQSLARPGQVLIDAALHSVIRAELPTQPGWTADSEPRRAFAKGVGALDLYELAVAPHWRLKDQLAMPFSVNTEGRPSVAEKIALIRNAQHEIVEIGIGLTNFARYFEGQSPGEFRDPIRRLVRGGVDLKCFALDPAYEPGVAWLAEQGNPTYDQEAALARRSLEREAKDQRDADYRGAMTYHTYRRVPEFWCLGVDVEDPVDGRMFFAPYMMGIPRAAMPVTQVSRTSNPKLYAHFLSSVQALRQSSTEGVRPSPRR